MPVLQVAALPTTPQRQPLSHVNSQGSYSWNQSSTLVKLLHACNMLLLNLLFLCTDLSPSQTKPLILHDLFSTTTRKVLAIPFHGHYSRDHILKWVPDLTNISFSICHNIPSRLLNSCEIRSMYPCSYFYLINLQPAQPQTNGSTLNKT